jgi:hypothetical protein
MKICIFVTCSGFPEPRNILIFRNIEHQIILQLYIEEKEKDNDQSNCS